ncbi:hypothetical protein AVV67_gp114 [Escherichia phage vB_EcoM_VR25]|uniref:DUF7202 domain-containing protein n=1 Tax=Escherichia phage vB_EcoM_VR25 TaxID=1567028 RepID=A0A0A7HCQ8_9CAUD|nr:hypothetical protein AVV67_gp114 [Escherichia phage vB_EcoM_VR25]AIZ02458.1 hypothetical protein VR25_114 [Escherichia phage vB_EcoM_VR25]
MKAHYPHPFDPKNKATIIRHWSETRITKCPIKSPHNVDKWYIGEYVEYTFIDKNKRVQHVDEYCLKVQWL